MSISALILEFFCNIQPKWSSEFCLHIIDTGSNSVRTGIGYVPPTGLVLPLRALSSGLCFLFTDSPSSEVSCLFLRRFNFESLPKLDLFS